MLRQAIDKAIKEKRATSQRDIASKLGVSEFQLCRWAQGKLPDLAHRRKINGFLGAVYCEKCMTSIEQLKTKPCICDGR